MKYGFILTISKAVIGSATWSKLAMREKLLNHTPPVCMMLTNNVLSLQARHFRDGEYRRANSGDV